MEYIKVGVADRLECIELCVHSAVFIDELFLCHRFPYQSELPEAEQDNGGSTESVKEQEMKWTDLALQSLHENTPSSGS